MSKESGSATSAPTSMDTAFANLSDYMYEAYDTPYSSTPLSSDIGYSPLKSDGHDVEAHNDKNGFYAEAFGTNLSKNGTVTKDSQVIIAYEGTNLLAQGGTFRGGQAIDNAYIYAGREAPSAADSRAFADKVIDEVAPKIGKSNVFLTGHSLGGADAEYAAQTTHLAGVTFAAPGVLIRSGDPASKLTNYVDYNDVIGNYANDKPGNQPGENPYGDLLTSQDISHYGSPTIIDQSYISDSTVQDFVTDINNGDTLDAAARLGQSVNYYHPLTAYAKTLGLTLYLPDKSAGADADFFGSALTGAAGSAAGTVDPSYLQAAMTDTGGTGSAMTHPAASAAGSSLTADSQAAHALSHGSRHVG